MSWFIHSSIVSDLFIYLFFLNLLQYFSQDKLNNLQPIVEKMEGLEEQRLELEAKISEVI